MDLEGWKQSHETLDLQLKMRQPKPTSLQDIYATQHHGNPYNKYADDVMLLLVADFPLSKAQGVSFF